MVTEGPFLSWAVQNLTQTAAIRSRVGGEQRRRDASQNLERTSWLKMYAGHLAGNAVGAVGTGLTWASSVFIAIQGPLLSKFLNNIF